MPIRTTPPFRNALLMGLVFGATSIPLYPEAAEQSPPAQASQAPTYVPPLRGAPSRRVGGSTRGFNLTLPSISVIAPDHVGLTVSSQPVLYWFISKPTRVRLEITVIDESGVKPLLELPLNQVDGPAIHAIDLSRHGITLTRGMEYQWTVALVPDANERSGDLISGGAIKVVEPPTELRDRLARVPASELPPAALAAAGLWYDAIHALSVQIGRQPQDAQLRAQRAALAEQAGLAEVAGFDRKR
jgi:hypothetical protein